MRIQAGLTPEEIRALPVASETIGLQYEIIAQLAELNRSLQQLLAQTQRTTNTHYGPR